MSITESEMHSRIDRIRSDQISALEKKEIAL
jgi:hypothetical protein